MNKFLQKTLKNKKICYNCIGDKMKKAVKKVTKKEEKGKNEISELKKLAYIFSSIIVVFLIFYGIAYLKMNNKKSPDDEIVTSIQYEKILVSNILNQNKEDYYVLIYNDEEIYNNYYFHYISSYSKKENSLFTYLVDINNSFNSSYKALEEASNLNVSNISDLKVKEDTLLKISNGKIISTTEGMENISTYIKSLK